MVVELEPLEVQVQIQMLDLVLVVLDYKIVTVLVQPPIMPAEAVVVHKETRQELWEKVLEVLVVEALVVEFVVLKVLQTMVLMQPQIPAVEVGVDSWKSPPTVRWW